MFVHIKNEQRHTEGCVGRMVRCPVIVKLARVLVKAKNRPARTTRQSVTGTFEFGLPILIAVEPLLDQLSRLSVGPAVAAKIGKVMLVQDD